MLTLANQREKSDIMNVSKESIFLFAVMNWKISIFPTPPNTIAINFTFSSYLFVSMLPHCPVYVVPLTMFTHSLVIPEASHTPCRQ